MMHNILVAGAHGQIGQKVITLLKQSQYFNPVAMVRKKEYLEDFKNKNITAVLGDLTEDVDHVFGTIDKVIFAAGSGGNAVVEVDQEGAKNLISASKKAGIKKFVMLSSMGAENPENFESMYDYLSAKHNADEFLKQSELNYTIARPGTLKDEKGTGKIKKVNAPTKGEISREDVAQVLVRALHDDAPQNVVFEFVEGNDLIADVFESL